MTGGNSSYNPDYIVWKSDKKYKEDDEFKKEVDELEIKFNEFTSLREKIREMKTPNKKEKTEEENAEEYRKKFAELPLEKKIADLVKLEAMALSETFSFILNSPSHIVGKVMDVMAEFGLKMDAEAKDAQTPDEHKVKENGNKTAANEEKAEEKADEVSKDEPIEAIEDENAEVVNETAEENKETEAKA